jgi:hypothetical protein
MSETMLGTAIASAGIALALVAAGRSTWSP